MAGKYDKRIRISAKTRPEAENILDELHRHIEDYGSLSYADYINMIESGIGTDEDKKYGWFDLHELFISYNYGEYLLTFPLPVLLSDTNTVCKICNFNENVQFNTLKSTDIEFTLGRVSESFIMDLCIEARTDTKKPCMSITLFDDHGNAIEGFEYPIKYCVECGRGL